MTDPDSIVFVIDDDPLVRDSVADLIQSGGMNVRVFASATEFMQSHQPDTAACLILDVDLPDVSGLDLQLELLKASIDLPIIFITGHGDIPMSVRAMKAGAVGFLPKPFRGADLMEAIREALARDRKLREQKSEIQELQARLDTLTARERQVLALVVRGLLNKQVGAELGTTEMTIKVHRGRVMRKMKADSLPDLVRMAERLKLLV